MRFAYLTILFFVLHFCLGQDWVDLVDCVPEGFVDPEYCSDADKECEFPQSCYVEGGEDNIDEYGDSNFECKELPEECQEITTTEATDATDPTEATEPTEGTDPTDPTDSTDPTAETSGTGKTTTDDGGPAPPVGQKCTPATKPIASQDACDECCFWAGIGECDTNKFFMRRVCQKSCGTKGANMRNLASMTPKVPQKCKSLPRRGNGIGRPRQFAERNRIAPGCTNHHESCQGWAARGECDTNPLWMHPNCPSACNRCPQAQPVRSRPPTTGTSLISRFCVDFNPSCPGWAAIGECAANWPYMGLACCNSCSGRFL